MPLHGLAMLRLLRNKKGKKSKAGSRGFDHTQHHHEKGASSWLSTIRDALFDLDLYVRGAFAPSSAWGRYLDRF